MALLLSCSAAAARRRPADIAAILAELPADRLPLVYRLLPKELAAETFVEMDPEEQEQLIQTFSDTLR